MKTQIEVGKNSALHTCIEKKRDEAGHVQRYVTRLVVCGKKIVNNEECYVLVPDFFVIRLVMSKAPRRG